MDIDTSMVSQRLQATCAKAGRLVMWQDEAGTYRGILDSLDAGSHQIVDATGRELATKRRILREEPRGHFVVYRAGERPQPTDDLIYDITLRAAPFVCSDEGIWAEECGVPVELAPLLTDHAAFFNSKVRRAALASSALPKRTDDDLKVAMAAACLGVTDGTARDAARAMARRLVVELSRGKEAGLSAVADAGLADATWRFLGGELGYRVPDGTAPNAQDLAFRLLEGTLGELVEDAWLMEPTEASRIVADLSGNPRTRDAYEWLVREHSRTVFQLVPESSRSYESLESVEHVPQTDEWILMHMAADAVAGQLDQQLTERLSARRATATCAASYQHHYGAVLGLVRLRNSLSRYQLESPAAKTLPTLLEGYVGSWQEVDRRYREMHLHFGRVAQGRFGQALRPAVDAAEARYDSFLSGIASTWQDHALDEGQWPPRSLPSQTDFFREEVLSRAPESNTRHRVGVIISDALRYECAADLAERLTASKIKGIHGRTRTSISARIGVVPSYTQLGMAALLPAGVLEIDPATAYVSKDGKPTMSTVARQSLMSQAVPGTIAWQADELPDVLAKAVSDAPVVCVYHNVIDRTGDKLATERRTFRAVEEALGEIERIIARLLGAGCATVLITSDHGFIYQDRELEDKDFADVPHLSWLKGADGVDSEQTRRFVVSDVLPKNQLVIEYTPSELSLEGAHLVGVPRGAMRFRLSGSGARFVHGGVSPQECVVPVVTVERIQSKAASHPSGVTAFPIGITTITGSSVAINLYQEEPVGELVAPVTARVGVYAKDGRLLSASELTLELSSESESSDDRKTRVRLDLTGDIDKVDVAIVRVSRQVGTTNAFKVAWEREYRVNRAFGGFYDEF